MSWNPVMVVWLGLMAAALVPVRGAVSPPPDAERHWAFLPLGKPTPPDVRDAAWCRNEIDQFILEIGRAHV